MCWLLPHPHSTGTPFLGKCRRCLAALVVPAGGHQLLLPALRLLSPSQHWPSKLLCVSQCLPLEISRCSSPVRLETTPFLLFTMCWVRHLLLACTWGQEEPTYRCCSSACSWGKALACALVCTGMAVLMCHLPSQLSLEMMAKEQIPTSATSVRVSGKLLCCLSPLPPSLGHPQQPGPCGQCCRQSVSHRCQILVCLLPTSAGSSFHHGLGCFIQSRRQRVQVRPWGQLSSSS